MRHIFFALLAFATPVGAEEPPNPRELGGHVFMPSDLVSDPFTGTYFGNGTAFGFASATGPRLDEHGNAGTGTYRMATFAERFELQVGLLPWWSISTSVTGRVFSGITVDSAQQVGTQAEYFVAGGTTVSFRFGRVRIGGEFDVAYSPSYNLNIFTALDRSVKAGKIDASTLLTSVNTITLVGGLNVAVGLHRSLGLLLATQYLRAISDGTSGSFTEGQITVGGSLSLDLHALLSVLPIGMQGAYRVLVPVSSTQPMSQQTLRHEASLGLYYTGRANLVLGPDVVFKLFPDRADMQVYDFLDTTVLIKMRYYW